jgi:fluoride exporter
MGRETGRIGCAVLVFLGGALGAVGREVLMLLLPPRSGGFPLDILAANLAAACSLGLVAALVARKSVSADVYLLVGVGFTGGLSTFSSFVYASSELMQASVTSAAIAAAYVVSSLVLGYIAVTIGLRLGRRPA